MNFLPRMMRGYGVLSGDKKEFWEATQIDGEHYDAAVTVLEERLGDIVNRLYTFARDQGYEVTEQQMWAKTAVSSACGLGFRDPVAMVY